MKPRLSVHVPEDPLFHSLRNSRSTASGGFHGALPHLRRRLPANWHLEALSSLSPLESALLIRSPDGRSARLQLLSRRSLEPRHVARALAAASRLRSRPILVTAPFLSPRTRELLSAAGACYVDSTGNLRLVLDRPAVFIEQHGAHKDPARTPRPLHSLSGPAAARVVQALCRVVVPCGVRELASRAQIPVASVSRVVSLLTQEALLRRGPRGDIEAVDSPALLRIAAECARKPPYEDASRLASLTAAG